MIDSEVMRFRDSYVDAFNRGALEELALLFEPEVSYRWVAAGHAQQGLEQVLGLYRQGHEHYKGASHLTAVAGTPDQAIWWEPTEHGLMPRGLQRIRCGSAGILEIADEHDPSKVAAAMAGQPLPA